MATQTRISFNESGPSGRRVSMVKAGLDLLLILAISTVLEAAHFSWKQGRHVISADSVQYIDGAEVLIHANKTPHFEFRKPGYSFILAATALCLGNIGWGAVVINHFFQALLPLAAYGMGRNLRSRLAGWLAALLIIARLQFEHRGERIMSEACYTTVLALAVLLVANSLSKPRAALSNLCGGALMGFAWLTRSIAVAVVAAALVCTLWTFRREPRRALGRCLVLVAPVLLAVLLECALNRRYAGQFRTGTGTFGPAMLLRARFFDGLPFPETPVADRCRALLPERAEQDAFLVNKMDGWVARYRAIHDQGMDEWQVDALMSRAAFEIIERNPEAYLRSWGSIFVRCLLRQRDGPSLARVPASRRTDILMHPGARDYEHSQEAWYAYWALPHRSEEDSSALAERMHTAAGQRAPFGGSGMWAVLRYVSMTPLVMDVLSVLAAVASLWPGLALIFHRLLGLNRRTCLFLTTAYVLDAAIVAAVAFSDGDIARFQYVWLGTDTTLAAALLSSAAAALRQGRCASAAS